MRPAAFPKNRKGPTIVPKFSKLALLSVLSAGTVFAQPAPVPPPSAPPVSGDVDISVKQRPTLSSQEMLGQGKEYFKAMNETLGHIQTLQQTARRQKDIIKLNCVTDKMVQARVNLNIAEQSMTTLQESIARADEGGRTHEFTRLTIVNQKVLVLGAEAENCIGEDLSFVGATRVDVEVDPSIPQTDPTQPGGPVVSVERPPEASVFR
jgi:hypothetical protein